MKRMLALCLLLCLLPLCACAKPAETLSGTVTDVLWEAGNYRHPWRFSLSVPGGQTCTLLVTDKTLIEWRCAPEEDDNWSCFEEELLVSVEAVKEASGSYTAQRVCVLSEPNYPEPTDAKPVLYLYPEEETAVSVRLDYDGVLTCTYPAYADGWQVTAAPDGTLFDGKTQYNYLYWEGKRAAAYDFSEGFCVRGEDTAAFLEQALSALGLTRREANEFIVYWLPQMQDNAYNVISFQSAAYTDHARLTITPQPDTLLRVFMAWKASDAPVSLPPQVLTAPERSGFTVVEWGGARQ